MNITKLAQAGEQAQLEAEELALVNRLSRRELGAQEIYTFSVRLCDNEVDRDGERFPRRTLDELAELFVGKSGLFDHSWSATGQAARIYKTEVVAEQSVVTEAGEAYAYLKGYAYMVRTADNGSLIAEIEGGIKKEVSVGCAVRRAVCSICGEEIGSCPHEKGARYDGKLCFAELVEATDAYEFSFVAVPAQPRAGVIKSRGGGALKKAAAQSDACKAEYDALVRQAEAGRRYLAGLRTQVVRLGLLAGTGMSAGTLHKMAEKLEEQELVALRDSYEKQAAGRYPLKTQLCYAEDGGAVHGEDGAFLI